jgi:endonuclease/exonuclease/phosphatase family metal-dependent hydrolase
MNTVKTNLPYLKMKKIAGILFKVINITIILLCLSVALIPVLPSNEFWIIAILGLVFPVLFFILFLFFVTGLFIRSKWCVFSLVAMILCGQQVFVCIGINSQKPLQISKSVTTLRVLTWNISSWGETNKEINPKLDYISLMLELIKKQKPDVICLQEFWDRKYYDKNYSNIQLFNEMGFPYSYFAKSFLDNQDQKMGVAIISKYPITDSAKFSFGENDFAEHLIYADIQYNNQKVRVFTTHLQSVRFNNGEYVALRKIKQKDESGLKDSKKIIQKLKHAYNLRETEADLVSQKINESPNPVIVCGDFNDVPNSYTYFKIKGSLQDAFLKKGTGFGRTFQYLSPTLRIDFILADKNFNVEQYNRLKVPYSDHYPVVADLSTQPKL